MNRIRETKLVEVHGNDGASHLTHAENWTKKWLKEPETVEAAPNAKVIEAHFNGERCAHGHLVVAVDFEYDGDE